LSFISGFTPLLTLYACLPLLIALKYRFPLLIKKRENLYPYVLRYSAFFSRA